MMLRPYPLISRISPPILHNPRTKEDRTLWARSWVKEDRILTDPASHVATLCFDPPRKKAGPSRVRAHAKDSRILGDPAACGVSL